MYGRGNMATEKQEYFRSDDELCSLVFQTFTSSTDAVIAIDKEEDETLESKKKKTNNLVSNPLVPSSCAVIIIDDDEEETLDSKKKKKTNRLNSNPLVPSTNAVIMIDEEETLEPKKKKPRLGSWWDEVDAFNELGFVVKGLPKSKDAASIVDSRFSLTNLPETKPKESCSDSVLGDNKRNQDRLGYGHVSLEDSGVSVENPSLGGYVSDVLSPMDSCFPSSSSTTRLLETEANRKKDDERALSSSNHHGDNITDLREEEIFGGSTNSSNKVYRHVSLEELGVSVEDLKSMSWEAFDPTWEIRSDRDHGSLAWWLHMFSAH